MNEGKHVTVRSLVEMFQDACEESACGRLVALREGDVDGDVQGFSVHVSTRRSFEVVVAEIHPRIAGDTGRAPATDTLGRGEMEAGGLRDGARTREPGRRVPRNRDAAQVWRRRTEHADSYELAFLELFQEACLRNDCGRIVGFREALSEATGESGFNVFTVDRRLYEVTVVEV
jgi:hypothetical protein